MKLVLNDKNLTKTTESITTPHNLPFGGAQQLVRYLRIMVNSHFSIKVHNVNIQYEKDLKNILLTENLHKCLISRWFRK